MPNAIVHITCNKCRKLARASHNAFIVAHCDDEGCFGWCDFCHYREAYWLFATTYNRTLPTGAMSEVAT